MNQQLIDWVLFQVEFVVGCVVEGVEVGEVGGCVQVQFFGIGQVGQDWYVQFQVYFIDVVFVVGWVSCQVGGVI